MNLLEARLVESRQRALDLADRLEEADRRACETEQQLASEKRQHQIMDAAYWAAKGQLDEQTAALGALAAVLKGIADGDTGVMSAPLIARQALAPDAVQQAVEEYQQALQPLFQLGNFSLHSGERSRWRIECNAAKQGDWEAWAAMIAELQVFGSVVGVPSQEGHKPNGLILARELEKYATDGPILVVDDVLTTGNSMKETMAEYPGSVGWVVYARGDCPPGVQALFQMPTEQYWRAMQVVERVQAALEHYSGREERMGKLLIEERYYLERLKALLGDAAQEEKP